MRALTAAAFLASFAFGFAAGRGDGHAYAGATAALLAGILVGFMAAASGLVLWVWWEGREAAKAPGAAVKGARVEQEV